jgi:hypothetical protein
MRTTAHLQILLLVAAATSGSSLAFIRGDRMRSPDKLPRRSHLLLVAAATSGSSLAFIRGDRIRCRHKLPRRSHLLAMSSATDGFAEEFDVVVVGSGLGGLSAGALCTRYGLSALVCEAHYLPGGCAHSFERAGYRFDSGPSLWSGCAAPSYNPLRQVLDAVGESPQWVQYDGWWMYTEEGPFYAKAGDVAHFKATMAALGNGAETVAQWDRLVDFVEPLQRAVLAVPPLALRADLGAIFTAGPYLPAMADPRIGLRAYLLSGALTTAPPSPLVNRPLPPLFLSRPLPPLPSLSAGHYALEARPSSLGVLGPSSSSPDTCIPHPTPALARRPLVRRAERRWSDRSLAAQLF